ncbi:MAG: UV DNA damage repair endonuclease UvsE [Acidobacteriota bacterium]|nr:UV DNA damage repair endonuclease UvsE [Acidobacteriota bacterium]
MSLRLGFPVKVLGTPGLKSNDTRRWQSNPHLRVSLEYLSAIFDYLQSKSISMYRMGSDLAPYASHPDLPQFHNQVTETRKELKQIGRRAQEMDLRLSFHPSQFIVLNSPDAILREKSTWDLRVQTEILDAMELGPEAVMVIHVGGLYGDTASGLDRWCRTWEALPDRVRARLVLEHDDLRFSAADVLAIHARTGVRLVFDLQHFWCLNPEQLELKPTVEKFLATWPRGIRPKIHVSSPRTEMREVQRKDRKTGKKSTVLQAPVWTGHADFVHPWEFISFFRAIPDLEADVMLEAKTKDLALLRLRQDLLRYAPDVAQRFGLSLGVPLAAAPDEVEVDDTQLADAKYA